MVSFQIHPHGHCALTRNISYDEQSEWSCVHDLHEELDEEVMVGLDDDDSCDIDDDDRSKDEEESILQDSSMANGQSNSQSSSSRKRKCENSPIEEFRVRPSSSSRHRWETNNYNNINENHRGNIGRRMLTRRRLNHEHFSSNNGTSPLPPSPLYTFLSFSQLHSIHSFFFRFPFFFVVIR